MAYGLVKDSQTKEAIEKVDADKAVRYKVVEEGIDLNALKQEKASIQEQLSQPEPSKAELIELGKASHPYYQSYKNRDYLLNRLNKINSILGE